MRFTQLLVTLHMFARFFGLAQFAQNQSQTILRFRVIRICGPGALQGAFGLFQLSRLKVQSAQIFESVGMSRLQLHRSLKMLNSFLGLGFIFRHQPKLVGGFSKVGSQLRGALERSSRIAVAAFSHLCHAQTQPALCILRALGRVFLQERNGSS